MLRSQPFRLHHLFVALTVASAVLTAAPAVAQSTGAPSATERYDDPVGNGVAIGAALGAIGGVLFTGAIYAECHNLCDAPAELPTYAVFAGLGAGAGAGVGWLVDTLHKGKRPAAVPVTVNIRADRQGRAVRLQWRF
ncbi:MAG: hypothetical protein ABIT71_18595 [Vicinamibacteraceae bacterium]